VAHGVVHVAARVADDGRTGVGDRVHLGRGDVDAVGQQGLVGEQPGAVQPLHDTVAAAGVGVGLVGTVLGHVDVHAHATVARGVDHVAQGVVGQRERRVRPHHAARESRGPGEEAAVLGHAGRGAFGSVAVADLVAQDAADPEPGQGVGDDVERAVDGVRRGVVVDDGRGARAQGVEPAAQRGGTDGPLVERAVEAPPDPLEDLGEGHRWIQAVGHPPAQGRVQVVVGADVAGQDQGPGAVPAYDARRRHAHGRDPVPREHDVGGHDLRWVERDHHRPPAQRQRGGALCFAGLHRRALLPRSTLTVPRRTNRSPGPMDPGAATDRHR
jgi:hypothetical protein